MVGRFVTPARMRAASIKEEQISMERSAASGPLTFAMCLYLSATWTHRAGEGELLFVSRIYMNRVHIGPFDTLPQDVVIPLHVTKLSAKDKADTGIHKLESFCPLVCFLCIVLFCRLSHLPFTVDLVAQSPIFDVVWFRMTVFAPEIGPVGVSRSVAILKPSQSYESSIDMRR
jgi:hypothetical protein